MLSAQAQHVQESKFCSPFDFPILLSANFGELRPNHFHNGLDIKTQGVTGKTDSLHCRRLCVARGSAARRIRTGHLRDASQRTDFGVWTRDFLRKKIIQAYVRQYQYAHETFVCDLKFQPGQFPVKKGRHHCPER